ncbi:hypothetical protein FSHL1_011598 [Fusarium sambucinum]
MAPARQQPAPPPFSKDEKVLCFHMDMLYEAKIMDVQQGEKPSDGYKYKVHYKGWKNTWDDWVLVDRIRPFDDEHKELAAQLHAQLKHNIQRSTKQPKKGLRSGAESARVSEERSGSATVQGGRGDTIFIFVLAYLIAMFPSVTRPPFAFYKSVVPRKFWAVTCNR